MVSSIGSALALFWLDQNHHFQTKISPTGVSRLAAKGDSKSWMKLNWYVLVRVVALPSWHGTQEQCFAFQSKVSSKDDLRFPNHQGKRGTPWFDERIASCETS